MGRVMNCLIEEKIIDRIFRTFRQGMCDLKIWPNTPPDVKYHSTTPGKIDPIAEHEQASNRTTGSSKPPVIQWDDANEHPMLDELSRISKVSRTPIGMKNALI